MRDAFDLTARAAVFAALWWVLVGGRHDAWWLGLPLAVAAALVSRAISPSRWTQLRLSGLLRLLPFFLRESLRGGLDVARRAFAPGLPLAPAFVRYRLRLSSRPARIFFVNTVSLLPGTLSALMRGDELWVHALDARQRPGEALAAVEDRVADAFGERLPAPDAAEPATGPTP